MQSAKPDISSKCPRAQMMLQELAGFDLLLHDSLCPGRRWLAVAALPNYLHGSRFASVIYVYNTIFCNKKASTPSAVILWKIQLC